MLFDPMQFMLVTLVLSGIYFFTSLSFFIRSERKRRAELRESKVDVAEAASTEESPSAAPTAARKVPFLSLITRRKVLTDNELEFFQRLLRALPEYHIFPQVAFSAVIKQVDGLPEEQNISVFRKFAQKRLDYLVCERESLKVVAVIELDDKSHTNQAKDWRREGLLRAGGYNIVRYSSKAKPTEQQIAAQFKSGNLRYYAHSINE